jgi:hypothetical protein
MDVTRILVVQETAETSRDLRLTTSQQPVEFSFCTSAQVIRGEVDLTPYIAIVATLDCDHRALTDSLREGPDDGPPLFLFRSEPPLQEITRWVTWTKPQDEADPAVTRRLLSESMEYYSLASLYQQCLKIMACQDEEKLLAHVAETFTHELGAESCVIWIASPLDPDEMMIASVRGLISINREGSKFYLSQTDLEDATWKGKPFLSPYGAEEGSGAQGIDGEANLYIPLLYREKPIGLVKLVARTTPISPRSLPGTQRLPGKTPIACSGWKKCLFATRRPMHTPRLFCRTTSKRNDTRQGGSAGPFRSFSSSSTICLAWWSRRAKPSWPERYRTWLTPCARPFATPTSSPGWSRTGSA